MLKTQTEVHAEAQEDMLGEMALSKPPPIITASVEASLFTI